MTQAASVRARLVPSEDPSLARLNDPLVNDVAGGGPLARARFDVHWSDAAGLRGLGEAKRGPIAKALASSMLDEHKRLGAPPESLTSLERLSRGDAVCAISGQQPAPLGGPLYAFHKVAATVGLARRFEARTGIPCVPVFWMHGEDSDFEEIRTATVADAALTLHDLSLSETIHRLGALIGDLPHTALADVDAQAAASWAGLPGATEARDMLEAVRARARNLGDATSGLMLAAFGAQGLVVVDPRLPAFRAEARVIIDRYLADADALHAAARAAGDEVERLAGRRPLNDATLESFVFAIEDGIRHKIDAGEAKRAGTDQVISPNVALRPVVQDGVLPTVAMAVGPGEAGYLAQLREVFHGLGVRPACAVPRFSATWLPPAALELMEASGADPATLITATDAVLRHAAEMRVPAAVRDPLERAQRDTLAALEAFAARARDVDASLPQMVDSARGKVDYQFNRLRDGVTAKVRHQLERQHPEWLRLRYYLLPGDRPQERRLASMEPVAHRGRRAAAEMADLAESHAAALEQGRFEHLVLDL